MDKPPRLSDNCPENFEMLLQLPWDNLEMINRLCSATKAHDASQALCDAADLKMRLLDVLNLRSEVTVRLKDGAVLIDLD